MATAQPSTLVQIWAGVGIFKLLVIAFYGGQMGDCLAKSVET